MTLLIYLYLSLILDIRNPDQVIAG